MKSNFLYYFIVGETSGDQHGALLMKELLKLNPKISFKGVGGNNMAKYNFNSLFPLRLLAVMGFWEVFKKIVFFKNVENKILYDIQQTKPKRVILIDYPGLNLRLAKKIKNKFKIKITYYITPQVWAWKEKRIEILKNYVDQLIVIFPFEVKYFKSKNLFVNFVGHPFFDEWKPSSKNKLKTKLNLNKKNPVLTLFPGSRKDEIKKHIHIFIQSALKAKQQINNLQIVIGCAPNMNINDFYKIPKDIFIENKNPRLALECSDFAILASGTATIEASIFNVPAVIIYKSSWLSWLIAKFFINTPFIGMSNIIANKEIMPEFVQYKAKPLDVSNEIIKMHNDINYYKNIVKELSLISKKLGTPGASKKTAKLILKEDNE